MFTLFAFMETLYYLYRYYTYKVPCDLLIPYGRCFIIRGPMIACFYACQFVLLSLVIERISSTCL